MGGGVVVLLGVILLAMAGRSSANYCVCKSGVDEKSLQAAIDFACGAGADCNAIAPNGACYNPNSIQAHCSYAVNSYYQKKAGSGATCDFGGAATLTASNPSSSGGCSYSSGSGSSGGGSSSGAPSTGSGSPTYGGGGSSGSRGSGTTPVTVTPSTTPSTTTPVSGTPGSTSTSPYSSSTPTTSATPSTASPGILGGVGTGLGPTGTGLDDSHAGMKLQGGGGSPWMIFLAAMIPAVMLVWN